MRRWQRQAIVAAVVLGATVPASAGDPGLFLSRASVAGAPRHPGLGVVRSRPVRLNPAALPAANGLGRLPRPGHSIALNLFPGLRRRAVLTRAVRIPGGLSWVGRLAGEPLSDVVLTVHAGVLTGSVVWPGGAYRIVHDGRGPVVEEIDQALFPEGDACAEPSPALASAEPAAHDAVVANGDDGSLIDLLVLYTPSARAAAGGTAGIVSLVNTAVAETNTGYENSGVVPRLRLAAAVEVAYGETGTTTSGMSSDLSNLANGRVPQAHALRETHAADLVALIVTGYNNAQGACGIAYVNPNSPAGADYAFAVVDRTCATGYYSFGHELGHTMGLNHARQDYGSTPSTGAFPYSFGYKDPANRFRTVMAYNCPVSCPRVLHFSNPGVNYQGSPTGISQASASSANAALSLNDTRVTVANWRAPTNPVLTLSTPNGGESFPAGSTWPVRWSASGLAAGATLRLQYANGSVTYPIASGLPESARSYNWTVPDTRGTGWRLVACSEIAPSTCEAQDGSDAPFAITAPAAASAARHDLDGDGRPDVLWHDQSGGALRASQSSATRTQAVVAVDAHEPDLQWQVRALADLNADGRNDLVWQHDGTRELAVWLMNGASRLARAEPTPASRPDPAWQLRGAADVDADGRPDLLWHHPLSGLVQVWRMSGLARTGIIAVATQADPRWAVRAFGDIDGDGHPDVLWHDAASGALLGWRLVDGVRVGDLPLVPAREPDTQWRVAQLADRDGDGWNDIVWQHARTRRLRAWFLRAGRLVGGAWLLGWERGDAQPARGGAWDVAPR